MNKMMKKILAVVVCLLMTQYLINAQTDSRNRVTSTIIADALNMLPANDKASEDKLMVEILETGSEGIVELAKMLKPASAGGNARIEYALDGLCDFVSDPANKKYGLIMSDGLRKAIEKADNDEVKAYLISLLRGFGNRKDVDFLLEYVKNENLAEVAIQTIASIPDAARTIIDLAENSTPENRKVLAYAIADNSVRKTEDILIRWLDGADVETQEAVYYALSVVGGEKSLKLLSAKAKSLKYNYDPTDATASYVRLLGKYATRKDTAVVENGTAKMLKSKNANINIAAMNLLVQTKGEAAVEMLLKSLKNKDKQVRTTALGLLKPYADSLVCAEVVKVLGKKNTVVEAVEWLGDVRCTTQMQFLENQLVSDNPEAVSAAIVSLVNIGDKDGMMSILPLFGTEYQPVIKSAIVSTKNDYKDVIYAAFDGTDQQKIAAMNILESRSLPPAQNMVKRCMKSNNQDVKDAAYKALKGVCNIGSADYLRELLQTVENKYVEDVQNAIMKSMAHVNDKSKSNFVYLLKNVEPAKITRFYKVFAYFGDDLSIMKLLDGYKSAKTRDEALDALLSIDNVSLADTLYNIGIKDKANMERIMKRYVYLIDKSDRPAMNKLNSYRLVLGLDPKADVKNQIIKYMEATQLYQSIIIASYYLDDEETAQQAANTIVNIATRHPEFNGQEITDLLLKIKDILNDGDAMYKRTQIDEHLKKIAQTPKFELSDEEKAEGFVVLFDGTSLDKWVGDKNGYIIQNGNIYVSADYGDEGNLYTADDYADFVYRFEFCFMRPGVNNGVGIRTPMHVDAAYYGMEIQILDHDDPIYAGLREYQVHGSVYGVIPAKRVVFPELGTWNTEEIYAKGDHIRVTVNGEVIVDGDIRKACNGRNVAPEGKKNATSGTIDKSNHPGLFNKSGKISFCGHGEGLLIRNIRVKEL